MVEKLERCALCGDPVDRRSDRVSAEVTWWESSTGEVVQKVPTGRIAHRRCVLDVEVADRWRPL